MLERLAAPMETEPRSSSTSTTSSAGWSAAPRALDSAFVVRYDKPILGHAQWRQRNVTVVGGGHSLCVVTYAPAPCGRSRAEARALLDAVLASVTLH